MKKILLLLGLFCISGNIFSQIEKSEEWKNQLLKNKYLVENEILNEILKYDFSEIISYSKYEHARVGYIGNDYQRIQIHFISVIKNTENPNEYFVYGKSKVKNNICEFQGKITFETARFYKYSELENAKSGFIIANYSFFENPKQKHVGYFKGKLKTSFYLNEKGEVLYDDIILGADGYSNNKFVGSWISYSTNIGKPCNWGDFRIPFSEELDHGAGEFIPDEKYIDNGWNEYLDEIKEWSRTREIKEWWK